MQQEDIKTITLSEIIEIVKRHKLTLVLCTLFAIIPVLIYNHIATPIYRATAVVVFENFSKGMMPELDNPFAQSNFITNRIEEIKTRTFARQVHDELPEKVKELFRLPTPSPEGFVVDEFIVSHIRKNIEVEPVRNTDIVKISYFAEHPGLARDVTNTITAVLQSSNLKVRRSEFSSVKSFIDQQIEIVKSKLEAAEEALREFKKGANITSLENESREVLQRVTQAENLYNQIQAEKQAKRKRLAVVNSALEQQKDDLGNSVARTNSPVTAKLKERLVELQVRYANLQVQDYPKDHPKLIGLKNEIEQIRQSLVDNTMKILEEEKLTGLIDPIAQIQKNLEESIALEADLQAQSAQENHLKKIIANYSGYLQNLPDKEITLFRLQRDLEMNNEIYKRLRTEQEQARIQEAAEIGNIRVMEPAILPGGPSRPRKMLNILVGLFSGLVFGLFISFLQEFIRETPRTEEELEQILKLPVLASIPKIKHGISSVFNQKSNSVILIDEKNNERFYQDAFSYLWSSIKIGDTNSAYTILITSTSPEEGKSTIAANLAITAARQGLNTILIDGDLRKPVQHLNFRVAPKSGLSNLLKNAKQTKHVPVHEIATTLEDENVHGNSTSNAKDDLHSAANPTILELVRTATQSTPVPNLYLLTKGQEQVGDPGLLWANPLLNDVAEVLRHLADFIVVDAPPVIGIPDARMMARLFNNVIFCVESAKAQKKMLLRAQKALKTAKANLLGAVLNKAEPASIYGYQKYYKYYG